MHAIFSAAVKVQHLLSFLKLLASNRKILHLCFAN
jgi:hypothetical protein